MRKKTHTDMLLFTASQVHRYDIQLRMYEASSKHHLSEKPICFWLHFLEQLVRSTDLNEL